MKKEDEKYCPPLNSVPPWLVSPSEEVKISNVPGLYLRKYGICINFTPFSSCWLHIKIFQKKDNRILTKKIDNEKWFFLDGKKQSSLRKERLKIGINKLRCFKAKWVVVSILVFFFAWTPLSSYAVGTVWPE